MRDAIAVALVTLMTNSDTMLIIRTAIRDVYMLDRRMPYLMFLILSVTHPVASFIIDSLARLPGLRFASAAITLLFAFSLAGSRLSNRGSSSNRSVIWACWTVLWMDIVMSVDTVMLISQTSPSVYVTAAGSMIGIALLLTFLPFVLRLFQRIAWLQVAVAGGMAYSASRQLAGEPLIAAFADSLAFHLLGLALAGAVFVYGWARAVK
ncbi:TerC family protein [Paenibacillus alkalitolerans]|uniref:TerC family protein n=1 Tax=Paenibacillus alkalitolerans TaxID=2799335 RepID=UPI0018F6069F|nr:hypothetical protein [Paenibacillus alkalitolerans]